MPRGFYEYPVRLLGCPQVPNTVFENLSYLLSKSVLQDEDFLKVVTCKIEESLPI